MAKSLDIEIQETLPLLGNEEKKSLLGVIKSFLNLKKQEVPSQQHAHQNEKSVRSPLAEKGHKYETQDELGANAEHTNFSKEELSKFYERREQYLSGNMETYSVEEAHNLIRQSKNKK